MNNEVCEVEWTEYERGWGQRPAGYSYHPTREMAQDYIDRLNAGMPRVAPDYYSAASRVQLVEVDPVFVLMVQGKEIVWTDKSCSITE